MDASRKVFGPMSVSIGVASFNPCSHGCQPESASHLLRGRRVRSCFNPCSHGCQPESSRGNVGSAQPAEVSILVLMDASRKALTIPRLVTISRVSILVLMDASRKDEITIRVSVELRVSILVLMDASRKDKWESTLSRRNGCFNPCSHGCQPESHGLRHLRRSLLSFNPCSHGCQPERFVSSPPARAGWCFNPCSHGCQPERVPFGKSLIEFIESFNPCSHGCQPERSKILS